MLLLEMQQIVRLLYSSINSLETLMENFLPVSEVDSKNAVSVSVHFTPFREQKTAAACQRSKLHVKKFFLSRGSQLEMQLGKLKQTESNKTCLNYRQAGSPSTGNCSFENQEPAPPAPTPPPPPAIARQCSLHFFFSLSPSTHTHTHTRPDSVAKCLGLQKCKNSFPVGTARN